MSVALAAAWKKLAIDVDGLRPDKGGTLRGTVDVGLASTEHANSPGPANAARPATLDGVLLGATLGEGGMGVVCLGEQVALRRQVAVKQPRPERQRAQDVDALVREAWVAGNLEHPNIVPIHTLVFREAVPLLVMKRIEGKSWSEVLANPDGAGIPTEPERRLEWHIEVAMQVCRAVHFAHSRGVLHLDIKPDNVMVGAFGEVYLVDWGIAAGIGPERPEWLPDSRLIASITGTPAFLSPEQAEGAGARLGHHTDVYLLGATLHAVVTGAPLRTGRALRMMLIQAFESKPFDYDPSVPRELANILHRATAREPADRYPNAEALRQALEAYLRHRTSHQLAAEALIALRRIKSADGIDFERTVGVIEIQREIAECRFAFRHALKIWGENPDALRGRQELARLVVLRALAQRDLPRAREALSELTERDERLAQQVDRLREELRRDAGAVEALRDLGRQVDLETHRDLRSRFALFTGVGWLFWNTVCGVLHRTGTLHFTQTVMLVNALCALSLYGAMLYRVRRNLLDTRVNRQALMLVFAGVCSAPVLWLGGAALKIGVLESVAMSGCLYVFTAVALAGIVDRRASWTVAPAAGSTALAALLPRYAFEFIGMAGFSIAAGLAWAWRRPTAGAETAKDTRANPGQRHELGRPKGQLGNKPKGHQPERTIDR
ncbi:MAG: serine/threonine protein kinase [Myxococcales bacterium]|nr:serine/threonine protein kinase [Myxococcales bacterium]